MEISIELLTLGKIVLSAVLSGWVGLEREFAEKPAGLRTHMLVGATATLLLSLAVEMVTTFEPQDVVSTDPTRIIQGIIVGISFLGAGTILKHQHEGQKEVEGLATSASILSVAAIGIAVAMNAFILALGVTVMNVLINWGIQQLLLRFPPKEQE